MIAKKHEYDLHLANDIVRITRHMQLIRVSETWKTTEARSTVHVFSYYKIRESCALLYSYQYRRCTKHLRRRKIRINNTPAVCSLNIRMNDRCEIMKFIRLLCPNSHSHYYSIFILCNTLKRMSKA